MDNAIKEFIQILLSGITAGKNLVETLLTGLVVIIFLIFIVKAIKEIL